MEPAVQLDRCCTIKELKSAWNLYVRTKPGRRCVSNSQKILAIKILSIFTDNILALAAVIGNEYPRIKCNCIRWIQI